MNLDPQLLVGVAGGALVTHIISYFVRSTGQERDDALKAKRNEEIVAVLDKWWEQHAATREKEILSALAASPTHQDVQELRGRVDAICVDLRRAAMFQKRGEDDDRGRNGEDR